MYAHNRWQANFRLSDSVKMRTKKEGTRCPSLFYLYGRYLSVMCFAFSLKNIADVELIENSTFVSPIIS